MEFKVGQIYKVSVGDYSSVKEPYLVRVVSSDKNGFKTELVFPHQHHDPHIREFRFKSVEWEKYHKYRFKEHYGL